jgi:hypothetical protein
MTNNKISAVIRQSLVSIATNPNHYYRNHPLVIIKFYHLFLFFIHIYKVFFISLITHMSKRFILIKSVAFLSRRVISSTWVKKSTWRQATRITHSEFRFRESGHKRKLHFWTSAILLCALITAYTAAPITM